MALQLQRIRIYNGLFLGCILHMILPAQLWTVLKESLIPWELLNIMTEIRSITGLLRTMVRTYCILFTHSILYCSMLHYSLFRLRIFPHYLKAYTTQVPETFHWCLFLEQVTRNWFSRNKLQQLLQCMQAFSMYCNLTVLLLHLTPL